MSLDAVYTSSGYNSYYATVSEINDAVIALDGAFDVSLWDALTRQVSISTLIVAGGVATVTTSERHGFVDGQSVVIAGATPSGLNGAQTVTVVSNKVFTFATGESDVTATGTITAEGSDEVVKENLLLRATKDLNSFLFKGVLNPSVISPYNMKFPRTALYYSNGIEVGSTVIPQGVLDYIAIRCIELLANSDNGKFYDGRVKKQKIGKLEQEFASPKDLVVISDTLDNYQSYQSIKQFVSGLPRGTQYVERT